MALIIKDPTDDLLLSFMVKKKEYGKNTSSYLQVFKQIDSRARRFSIPLSAAIRRGFELNLSQFCARRTLWNFCGSFNSDTQECVFKETLNCLSSSHTCILSVPVGFGKTFLALKLAAHIGLKTLIIIPTSKKILQTQWRDEIKIFLPSARVQFLSSKTKPDRSSDIFITSSHAILTSWRELEFISFVIVDELHLVLSPKGYTCLLHIFPLYILGLSATPYRLDGSDQLVELFFGASQITRKLSRDYQVKVIFTSFQYKMEKTESGQLNWGAVLNEQARNEQRNQMIADLICKDKTVKFLVLCKRVDQIKDLAQKCREGGVAVQAIYEDIAPIKDNRSLVGSIQKLGTGFSDSTFKGLIIAADVQDYFVQYFGRVLRRPDDCPIIYDLVDDNFIMKKHFKERREIYETSGGKLIYMK